MKYNIKRPRKFSSIIELLNMFPDEQACSKHIAFMRWGTQNKCPYCSGEKVYMFRDGLTYKCASCRQRYSVRVRTIFEDSKLSLKKWFVAIYLETSHKKGISSHQLARDLNVTQKTAWFMLHRIREGLRNKATRKMYGIVEADETLVGGLEKNKHAHKRTPGTQGRSTEKKTAVAGILHRDGKEVRTRVVNDVSRAELQGFIREHVKEKSLICTDKWRGYNGLRKNFSHLRVDHGAGEYSRGDIHTNGIENFWSLLQRGIIGIYHHISTKHLQRYCDEFTFRFNTRYESTENRFNYAIATSAGRLTWRQLTND